MKPATLALLVGTVLGGAGGAWFSSHRAARAAAAAPRPTRDPVVAVGSRIAWDLPYVEGGSDAQRLDVYAPPDADGAPVVVYVHRGEWAKGDKSEVSFKPKLLNEAGVLLVSLNYRLSGEAAHPAQVQDVAAALRWVRDHIAEYGGAPERVVLMGHSAGCHIVSLVGLDPRWLAGAGLSSADLRGVVCWSGGAYDLPAKVAEGGMYAPYIEQNFGLDPDRLRDASPIAHTAAADPEVPFLFVSAGEGKALSRELSERMAREIEAGGGKAQALTLQGKTHFGADHDCGDPVDPLTSGALLLDFVGSATRADPLEGP